MQVATHAAMGWFGGFRPRLLLRTSGNEEEGGVSLSL